MMRKTSFLFCAGMLIAASAHAQDASSPEYVEARQRLQEGKTLYGQGNLDGARLKFEQACAVLKTPACQRALGLADFYTKRYLEALGNLQKALDDRELDTTQRKEITDLMQQAYDKTGHVEIHAPAGGRVKIDDTIDVGNAPLNDVVNVTIGTHTISVSIEGKTERKTVECSEGKVLKVDFADRFPNSGNDGHLGTTPQYETHKRMFPPPTGAIVTGVVGLVGLGLGIGFGVASGNANGDNVARGATANGICSTNPTSQVCLDGKSTRDSQQTDAVVSTVMYVAGGVLLATAVVWWLVAPRKVVEHQAMILPSIGPHGAGAAFNFTF
ncbi:MAG TPA: hypothetical protein VGH28_23985 [Polyangiaceae bacterium]|jgi:hypothetical protein